MSRAWKIFYGFVLVVVATYLGLLVFEPTSCPGDWNDSEAPADCQRWADLIAPFFVGSILLVPVAAAGLIGRGVVHVRARRSQQGI